VDEISVLAAVRPSAPDFPAADREAARQQLLAAIAGERADARQPGRAHSAPRTGHPGPAQSWTPERSWTPEQSATPRRSWTPRRIGAVGATLAALTAMAAGLLIVLPGARPSRPSGPARPSAGAQQPGPPATASGILLLAARAAAAAPSPTPGPRQFVYTEQFVTGQVVYRGTRPEVQRPYQQRSWQSVNGMWGGVLRARDLPGGHWTVAGVGPWPVCAIPDPSNGNWKANCPLPPAYVTTLPSSFAGMLSALLKAGGPNGRSSSYFALQWIESESWEAGLLIPNQSVALMFRAASTIKGIQVIRGVTNVAGRHGIAVAACGPEAIQKGSQPGFHGCPKRLELIFDTSTYQLIGVTEVTLKPAPGNPAIMGSALLKIGVVSKIGQLP
jgi:hypothetical protein